MFHAGGRTDVDMTKLIVASQNTANALHYEPISLADKPQPTPVLETSLHSDRSSCDVHITSRTVTKYFVSSVKSACLEYKNSLELGPEIV